MPPLLYFVAGFIGGYLVRHFTKAPVSKPEEAADVVLDSVGRLSRTGALHQLEGIQLKQGSENDGISLVLKTR